MMDEEISVCTVTSEDSIFDTLLDDDDEDDEVIAFAASVVAEDIFVQRVDEYSHYRTHWDGHVEKLLHEIAFESTFRMSYETFMLLRWYLAGDTYQSIKDAYGCSKTAFFLARDKVIDAILEAGELAIKLPETLEDWKRVKEDFALKSLHRLMNGCIGALDGFFQPIIMPSRSECNGNQRAFHSGHYNQYGVNCQALVDARLRFMFFAVIATGSTGDSNAIDMTNLLEIIQSWALLRCWFIVADAAYTLSEILMTPFGGLMGPHNSKWHFNFYLSQVRIRVEMAFGRLVGKWRILRSPLCSSLKRNCEIIQVCAMLHNFVIDNDYDEGFDILAMGNVYNDVQQMPGGPSNLGYLPVLEELVGRENIQGVSTLRDTLHLAVVENEFKRPESNLTRNMRSSQDE